MPDVANISFEDKILLDDIDQRRSRSSVLVSHGGQTRNIFTRHMAAAAASGNTAVTPPTVHPAPTQLGAVFRYICPLEK